ncbi:Somatostatin receptor type 4 [Exaiptasia diaphana]|nr:Somatostatin receptor type 4 [Exaiptasia diaphana]
MPLWMFMTVSGHDMPMGLYLFYMSFDVFSAFASILHLTWYHHNWHKEYALFVFISGFILPIITITVVYASIYKIANSSVFRGIHLKGTRSFQAEKKLAKTVVSLCFLFFITWCPFFVVSLLGTFKPSLISSPSPTFIWYITVFVKAMHYSNSAMNTFVYAFSSREMRRTFNSLLRCKKNMVLPRPPRRKRHRAHVHVFHLHSVDSL